MTALKKNHHYVPQFWLRKFADTSHQIFGWDGKKSKQVSTRSIMQADWLYTTFDSNWVASNALEDRLSVLENRAAQAIQKLEQSGQITDANKDALIDFVALQASRHPDILKRQNKRSKEMGEFFALSHDMTQQEFEQTALTFGINNQDSANIYQTLLQTSQEELLAQLEQVENMSPQNPQLPVDDFVGAVTPIGNALSYMDIGLLDCPTGKSFILGDTPVPQDNMSHGFTVPLSKSMAAEFRIATQTPIILPRRAVSSVEVDEINQTQWENTQKVVIGPDPIAFQNLR